MGKVEQIENDVKALSDKELAEFRKWFSESTGPRGMARWSRTFGRADSTRSPTRLSRTMRLARPRRFDPSRDSRLLGPLSKAACGGARARGSGVLSPEARSAASIASRQEGWSLLVGPSGCASSSACRRSARRSGLVLDRDPRRVRPVARLSEALLPSSPRRRD